MSIGTAMVSFGEWLPDQPALNNPGLLVANNVLPSDNGYAPFLPLATLRAGSFTLPGVPRGGFCAQIGVNTNQAIYAASNSIVYMADTAIGAGTFNSVSTGGSTIKSGAEWSFEQFDNLVFAAQQNAGLIYHTAGSLSTMTAVTGVTTPNSPEHVWKLGRFLIIGNLGAATGRASTIQWSVIDQPTNFPTPNSATAIAGQSGEQILDVLDGEVVGGFAGDQYGVVYQTGAITRMTYVGPPVVFQFDKVDQKIGCIRKQGWASSGQVGHFLGSDGFYKTDGVSVTPFGEGRVDKTFLASLDANAAPGSVTATAIVEAAFDCKNRNIVWSYPQSATVRANRMYAYNIDRDRWSSCDQTMRTLIEPSVSLQADGLYAFDSNNVLCKFNATAGAATITTGDLELNPGGRAFVSGVKPNVESTGTAPAVTVRVGSRSDLSSTPTYTATTTPTTRTGYADCRVDAKYHRAEVQIVGNFDKAVGLEFNAGSTGKA